MRSEYLKKSNAAFAWNLAVTEDVLPARWLLEMSQESRPTHLCLQQRRQSPDFLCRPELPRHIIVELIQSRDRFGIVCYSVVSTE